MILKLAIAFLLLILFLCAIALWFTFNKIKNLEKHFSDTWQEQDELIKQLVEKGIEIDRLKKKLEKRD